MAQATLNGQVVDDGGLTCSARFEWGTTNSYGHATQWQGGFVTGDLFNETIYGLGQGILYHYRAVVRNAIGIAFGQDVAFTTLVPAGVAVMLDDGALLRLLEVN